MRIKFMGTSDVREIPAGSDFGGVLSEPLAVDLVWDRNNNWVIDTDEFKSDVPKEVWDILLDTDPTGFRDVSEYIRVPLNQHQKMFLGMVEGEQKTEEEEKAAREEARKAAAEEVKEANAREKAIAKEMKDAEKSGGKVASNTGASATSPGGTTVGGST